MLKSISTLTPTLRSPFELYGTTKSLDINFESFDYEGVTYPLDYATFENEYEDHPSPEFRRKSFRAFSDALRQYQHTTAATYNMRKSNKKRLKRIYEDMILLLIIYYKIRSNKRYVR